MTAHSENYSLLIAYYFYFYFYFFFQVEDEVDEISKTEFEKLEVKLGETHASDSVETGSSTSTKSV